MLRFCFTGSHQSDMQGFSEYPQLTAFVSRDRSDDRDRAQRLRLPEERRHVLKAPISWPKRCRKLAGLDDKKNTK